MKYEELGLSEHAFSDDARKTVDELVAHEEEADNLIYWVESESMVLIEGPRKSGKTRLALEVVDEFRGAGKVIFIDLDKYKKEIDVAHLIIGSQSGLRKFFNKMPKDLVLIIDNAHSLDTDFYKRVQYFFDQGYLKSVVIVKKTGADLNLSDSIRSRIGNKVITLKPLTKTQIVEMASYRFEGFLNEEHLLIILNKSKDLTEFFENCEKVALEYVEKNRKKVDKLFIEKVLAK